MSELEDRVAATEKAIEQINHFTETITELDLPQWKGYVNGKMEFIETAAKVVMIEGGVAILLLVLFKALGI